MERKREKSVLKLLKQGKVLKRFFHLGKDDEPHKKGKTKDESDLSRLFKTISMQWKRMSRYLL